MTTLTTEMKTMVAKLEKDIKSSKLKGISAYEKDILLSKVDMIEKIKAGVVTNEIEIEKHLELDELIAKFNSETHIYGTTHGLGTSNWGIPTIFSEYKDVLISHFIHLKDGRWYLNDEKEPFPSAVILLNEIEERLFKIKGMRV